MRRYIKTSTPQYPTENMLQVVHDDEAYRFNCLHATIDERSDPGCMRGVSGHCHADVYHIVLYTKGRNRFCLNRELLSTRPGLLVVTSPGEQHDFSAHLPGVSAYSELTFSMIGSNGRNLAIPFHQLVELYLGSTVRRPVFPRLLAENQSEELLVHYQHILDWLETAGGFSHMFFVEAVIRMVIFIIRECFLPVSTGGDTDIDPMEKVKQHIEFHYQESLSVEMLAERACYSRGHFLREFKRMFGTSPIAYQQQLRINAASNLLRTTSFQAQEIAAKVGYEDVYHFTKTFKRLVGLSPIQYRKQSAVLGD